MALITVSGEPGCRPEEVARLTAQRLGFELITDSRLRGMIAEEFGPDAILPDRAWPHLLASIVARLAREMHLVVATTGAEFLSQQFPHSLRVRITAPESRRLGTLMVDRRLDRPAAKQLLASLDADVRQERKRRFGRMTARGDEFDMVLNSSTLDTEKIASIIESAVASTGIVEMGLLSPAAEMQLQFQVRLQLAKHGIAPPGKVQLKGVAFGHPSEEIFANLLDFYRITWDYEPRSFPIQWDKDGKALEYFTPDFYLPEFDLYLELTTMKQAHVTKKNRKVKLLRTIYPHVNIQVFYQKDFQNLIFKHGLAERALQAK